MFEEMDILVIDEATKEEIEKSRKLLKKKQEKAPEKESFRAEISDGLARVSDPVKMYLKEMGCISLLTREGEVEIAKRIESGEEEALTALLRCCVGIEYIIELGQKLHPDIMIMYTGTQVCSKEITAEDAIKFGEAIGRKPLIWDNYPVNDGGMDVEIHIGPIRGRSKDLYQHVAGILVNPMNQAEASKVALATYGNYFNNPLEYDPDEAWQSALKDVAGADFGEDLQVIAENSLRSCLGTPEAEKLEQLTKNAILSIQNGSSALTDQDVVDLEQYLDRIADASYRIVNDCPNTALRNELLPWLEKLENWVMLGKNAVLALRVAENGSDHQKILREIRQILKVIQKNPKRIMGDALMPLANLVLEKTD